MHFKAKFGLKKKKNTEKKKQQCGISIFMIQAFEQLWILMRNVWKSKSFFDVNDDNGFLNFQK